MITSADADLIRYARVLPLDIVQAKGNGHAGTAVGLTPLMTVLYRHRLAHHPHDPAWAGRDRFVLSAGHASLALYLQLFLTGYGLELEDLRRARTLHALTPGHPELGVTPGVETSTGPLGQGLGNAVGMAMEARRIRALLDPHSPAGESPFDHRIWCLASDGDLMEGLSHEAAALAGHLRLGRLVVLWDDNGISIEGPTSITTSEDVPARFAAYGFRILTLDDAEDLDAIDRILAEAAEAHDGEAPTFVRIRTRIGHPMPNLGGTAAAHAGPVGETEIRATKEALGLDPDKQLFLPDELLVHSRKSAAERGTDLRAQWQLRYDRWYDQATPECRALHRRLHTRELPDCLWDEITRDLAGLTGPIATRTVTARILAGLGTHLPELWGGSADLADTACGRISAHDNALSPQDTTGRPGGPGGRQIHFGIREHAMGALVNGMALSGLTRPFANGYLVFSDYMRPALRMAALMHLPVLYLFSHDSVAVGEDGPTHQPVEHLTSLRAVPGLAVARPADAGETLGVWQRTMERATGPTAIIGARQATPPVAAQPVGTAGAARGGYILRDCEQVDVLLLATGSEVHLACAAADRLADEGIGARIVSMPCLEWFEEEETSYQETVLPPIVAARVSVEAGATTDWWRYLGTYGRAVGVDQFGESGPGDIVLARAGINLDAVVDAARSSLSAVRRGDPSRDESSGATPDTVSS
ncbi:transketolase [Austwickia chelonae]|uniref:transketolase n=1 Tax=Austwickia chelonae NBRC 105200 TaxID=1184607 RepID=K6UL50_9MICO|nr:transketolase [Austwickia chelonae]GAB76936.1 transketolase [Austwickia chelonae NBRC 105200]SEW32533.1 transketolase [Austwickia chelonae]